MGLLGYSREFAGAVFGNCVVESESLWEFGAWEGGRRWGGKEGVEGGAKMEGGRGGQWEIQAGAAAAAGQSGLAGSAGRPPGIGKLDEAATMTTRIIESLLISRDMIAPLGQT